MTVYYPLANHTAQWFGGGSKIVPDKIVFHCTEGIGWPGYNGGGYAPHLTVGSDGEHLIWRQHIDLEKNARALRNEPGGVQTNLDGCIQVEVVGTCDRKSSVRGHELDMWNLPEYAIKGLADFVMWCHEKYDIPLVIPKQWPKYPSSPELDKAARMSYAEWKKFSGICGHLHVPENTHLDPGDFQIHEILEECSMPLTKEDKEWILDNVPKATWKWDGITAPNSETDPKNTTWQPQSYLRVTLNELQATRAEALAGIDRALAEVDALKNVISASDIRDAFHSGLCSLTGQLSKIKIRLEQ